MKQFKTLLIKELRTHRNNLLIPVWATASAYLLILIALLIGYFKFGAEVIQLDIPAAASANDIAIMYWAANMVIASLIGFASFIGGLGMADNMLNDDYKKKCEIFHLSQPVSLIKILGSKLTILFGVQTFVLSVLVMFNYLLMSTISSLYGLQNFAIGFMGSIQGIFSWFVGYLTIISLIWLFNTIFRNKGFVYLIFTMIGFKVATLILNHFTGWDLYSPFDYYTNVLAENISVKLGRMSSPATDINSMVSAVWYTLCSWRNAIRILISGALIAGSYFIYREREVA